MSLNNYYFNIPVSQWDTYTQYILEGIYGVKESDYKIKYEHDGIRRVEIITSSQIPLINSLPITIKRPDQKLPHYPEGTLVDRVGAAIRNAVVDYMHTESHYYSDASIIHTSENNLIDLIYQLAREDKITRFAMLTNNRFIVYIRPYPVTLLVKCMNDQLMINIYADVIVSTFDVDDGYSGPLECMNSNWIKWKEIGDLTAPIQPPNYV